MNMDGQNEVPWLTPRQRIVQRHGRRISIRLEEEFWTQLSVCAKEDELKLTDLVFGLTERFDTNANRASVLRTYCVRWLRRKLAEARFLKSNLNLNGILGACPLPCVIITPDRKLAAHNHVFAEKVLGSIMPSDRWSDAHRTIRLSLNKPISQILTSLTDKKIPYTEAHVRFTSGKESIQLLGRFCPLNKSAGENSPLLCFLRSENGT